MEKDSSKEKSTTDKLYLKLEPSPSPINTSKMVPPAEVADPLSENPEIRVIENPFFPNNLPTLPELAKSLVPMMPMLSSILPHLKFPLPGMNPNVVGKASNSNSTSIFPTVLPKIEVSGIAGLNGFNGNLPPLPGAHPIMPPPIQRPAYFIKQELFSPPPYQKSRKLRGQYKKKEKAITSKEKKPIKSVKKEFIEPSGPPFQLDYAPHLRCNGFRIETSKSAKDVIVLDDSPPDAKKLKIAPPVLTLEKQNPLNLMEMLGPPNLPVTPRDKMLALNPFGLGSLNMDYSKIPGFVVNEGSLQNLENLKNQLGLAPPKNQFHAMSSAPPAMPALHLLSPDLLQSLQLPALSSGKPISAPMSPNQKIYKQLQESFTEWKIGYMKKRANTIHTNAIMKHRINTLRRPKGMTIQFTSIENEFKEEKAKIFRKLKPEEAEEFCTMFLKNCVHHEATLNEKERELDDDVEKFEEWLKSQIDYTPPKPYLETVLPTFGQIVDMIKEAFLFLNLIDCNDNQRQQLTSAIQFDWTDPTSNPQRLITFSNNIKLPPIRILEIMQEAREKLRMLIFAKNYYMSIDEDVPKMDY